MRALIFILLTSACSASSPCVELAEQACLMAKEKARRPKGEPEAAALACEEAKARAQKADEAMNELCSEDLSTFRQKALENKR